MLQTSQPRNVVCTGGRSLAWYAARSSAVIRPSFSSMYRAMSWAVRPV